MKTYTICLIGLEQRRAIVVGGGSVASRKVQSLIEAGAHPIVISPDLSAEFNPLSESAQVEIISRPYQPGDLKTAGLQAGDLVVAATDDRQVNHGVAKEARQLGCLVNVVDDPEHSNFILPALVRRGELTFAISTGGASPALARRLRQRLESCIESEYEQYTHLLSELRPVLKSRYASSELRRQVALRLIDSDLFNVLKDQGLVAARQYAVKILLDS